MNRTISLHGALRDADPNGHVTLDLPAGCTVAAAREQLAAYLATHAPQVSAALVRRSALATADTILHEHQAIPDEGELAILPPVSGG